ncbi:YbbR-like domain-containing protein [Thermoactinomyces sp. DSM 45892]|uniref:CdaR family protein n=1 Tax=Thermoactinomyces sp. DSM 45892 TaxID=1882753 RepID=UPI000897A937|nr:CdaR family protein [Thermoactinomyces sp. DSM 45892]SDZ30273.1 YbbR domain-containing protein [Thermoactinomyces sp. DSM 45892]
MNKWLENNWVIRVISVLLAGVLWFMVHYFNKDQEGVQNDTESKIVPVTAEYDKEHYELIQTQKEVTIMMSGNPFSLQYASSRVRAKIRVDEPIVEGEQRSVPVIVTGIPSGVKNTVTPEKVTITLYKKNPSLAYPFISKEIPIQLTYATKDSSVEVVEIKANPSKITYYGNRPMLELLNKVDLPVELPKAEGVYRFRAKVPKPAGVEKVEPMDVEIYVKMKRSNLKQISDIPLKSIRIEEGLEARIVTPKAVDASLSGVPNLPDALQMDQIEAVCDLDNLPVGVHQVPIQIKLPKGIVLESQTPEKATIEIRSKS